MKQPFTWEAFEAAAAENPNLDILSEFSFDHLRGAELETMIERAYTAATHLKACLAYSFRVLEELTKQRLNNLETLQ